MYGPFGVAAGSEAAVSCALQLLRSRTIVAGSLQARPSAVRLKDPGMLGYLSSLILNVTENTASTDS